MASAVLQAPVRVSPTIKFFRWSFLASGVLYGAFHQSRLSRREAKLRVIEGEKKAIRDMQLAKEKKIASDREMRELEEMAGIKH